MRKLKRLFIIVYVFISIIIAGAVVSRKLIDRADRARLLDVRERGRVLDERIIELLGKKLQVKQEILRRLIELRIGREVMRLSGKNRALHIIDAGEREDVLNCI